MQLWQESLAISWFFLVSDHKKIAGESPHSFFCSVWYPSKKPIHSYDLIYFFANNLQTLSSSSLALSPSFISKYLHLEVSSPLQTLLIQNWPHLLVLIRARNLFLPIVSSFCNAPGFAFRVIFDSLLWVPQYSIVSTTQLVLVLCLMHTCFVWPPRAVPGSVGGSCREADFASI